MKRKNWHISGKLHVTGNSKFIGEEKPEAMLTAKFLFSPVAHANIISIDTSQAEAMPEIEAVLTAKDVIGKNYLGHNIDEEPLFPAIKIMYVGQPVAMVLSANPEAAEAAVKKIKLDYEELQPVLTIPEAEALKQWYIPEKSFNMGDVDKAIAESPNVLEGEVFSSCQEHFYFETQRALAVPGEGEQMTIYAATQSTMEVQESAARVLNTDVNNIIVDVKRLGGAFGGKESAGTLWGCLAAIGAWKTKRPVEVKLTRDEDFVCTGKRHPFLSKYRIGFDNEGKINAYEVDLVCNGGAYTDLSIAILQRGMFHADNVYFLPNARIKGRACRTNLPPNTAFRGFGAPQGIFVLESAIERIADKLQKDPIEIRLLNIYESGQLTPYKQKVNEVSIGSLYQDLMKEADYAKLKADIQAFNSTNSYLKRGLATVPVKFGISFTTPFLNQASALIWIYIDGTVSVTTGGVEMGQEVSTKMAIVVSRVLGAELDKIRVESSNTQRVANASPTAASTGSDINGNAARIAAEILKERLSVPAIMMLKELTGKESAKEDLVFAEGKIYDGKNPEKSIAFSALVKKAYIERIGLGAYGYYKTPGLWVDMDKGEGNPFFYFVYGCCLVSVEINTMTGDSVLKEVHIVHETSKLLSADIDRGQISGAFIQSFGWCTMEEMIANDKGRYISSGPSTYKIPCIRDLPEVFNIKMVENECKDTAVLGSKAVGEPPYIYGEAAFFAIRKAISSLNPNKEVELQFPATPEAILTAVEKQKKYSD